MTPEEGRALFPVLQRLAYLNAGTFGPLARLTAEALEGQLRVDVGQGRFGKEYFERVLDLRKQARALLGAFVGAEPEQVALTGSTTDGCNIVLAGDFNLRDPDLPGPNIDHIVVAGIEHGPLEVWPADRRLHNGAVLSDHAPVEMRFG